MNKDEPDDPEAPHTRRGAIAGLLLILVLVVGGLFLARVLRDASQIQDCVLSGRTNCAPIAPTPEVRPETDERPGSAGERQGSQESQGSQEDGLRDTDRSHVRHPRE